MMAADTPRMFNMSSSVRRSTGVPPEALATTVGSVDAESKVAEVARAVGQGVVGVGGEGSW